jgi:hypothetical protein
MQPNGVKLRDKSNLVGDGNGRGKKGPDETPTEVSLENPILWLIFQGKFPATLNGMEEKGAERQRLSILFMLLWWSTVPVTSLVMRSKS